MKKKKISISDIAHELGVSIATVSFILNGKSREMRISEKLTRRVLHYVKKVGYKPNHLAQSLRTGKTNTIALMVEDISNPFFSNVARLIEEQAYKVGYKIIYCSTENSTRKTREMIGIFDDKHVDGYIIAPPAGVSADIQALIARKIPVVLFDRYLPRLKTNFVGVDNYQGTMEAIEHLIGQGNRQIGFVTTNSTQTQMKERLQGYLAATEQRGKKAVVLKLAYRHDHANVTQEIASFLKKNRKLDAVFFATNYLANSGLEALQRLGYKIPADLRIVAFDDHDFYSFYNPTITAVAQPVEEISKNVISILLDHLEDGNRPIESVSLPTRLVVRASSSLKC